MVDKLPSVEQVSFSQVFDSLKQINPEMDKFSNAVKKQTAQQKEAAEMLVRLNIPEEWNRIRTSAAAHISVMSDQKITYDQANAVLDQSKNKIIAYYNEQKIADHALDKFKDTLSSLAKELHLTSAAVAGSLILVGKHMDEMASSARKASLGILPSGVYGDKGLDVAGDIQRRTIEPLIGMGLSAEEARKRLTDSAIAGMHTAGSFEEITQRVKGARAAEVLYSLNTETAQAFYDLVSVKMGVSVEDASSGLNKLMQDSRRTGLSTEQYGRTIDAVLKTTAVFGSSLGELNTWVAVLAPAMKEGKIQASDVASALANLRTASIGTQIGISAMAQAYGVAGGLGGVSPLGAPGMLMSDQFGGAESLKMQVSLAKGLAGSMASASGVTNEYEKKTLELMAAQTALPGLSAETVTQLMKVDLNSMEGNELLKEVGNTMKSGSPEEMIRNAQKQTTLTSSMSENIARIKDRIEAGVGSQAAGIGMQAAGAALPLVSLIPGIGQAAALGISAGIGIASYAGAKVGGFAEGGISYGPQMAMVSETEAEAHIPLSKLGGRNVNVTIGKITGKIGSDELENIYFEFKERLTEELEVQGILER